jgi:hypothetical protein
MLTAISNRVNTLLLVLLVLMAGAIIAILATRASGGPLDPPGAPASTLPQVEPRVPIDHVPVTISTPGSYFLTRNVSGPANTTGNGITIASDDVTLDLNGFSVIGTGADTSQAHGFGINVSLNPAHDIVIRNGVVRDWNYGVVGDGAHQSRIESVRALNNKWDGIRGGADTTITDSSSASNLEYGIVSFGGTVQHCEVDGNTSAGIFVTDNSVVKDNSVHNSLFDGIDVANNADVEGNSVVGSGGQGIVSSGNRDVIKDNLVEASAKNGIHVLGNSTVEGNTVVGNDTSLDGISAGILVAGSANTITANHATVNPNNDIYITGQSSVVTGNRTTLDIDHPGLFNAIGPEVGEGQMATNTNPGANFK